MAKYKGRDGHGLLLSYMRGWHAGAGCKPLDSIGDNNHSPAAEAFRDGWRNGKKAAHDEIARMEGVFGAKMGIITAN